MDIPYRWLCSYLDHDYDADEIPEIGERLTIAGVEVEKFRYLPAPEPLIVGRVEEVEPHPSADKLKVCMVDIGKNETNKIVCGAENVAPHTLVPLILPGGKTVGGQPIETRKIRGELSQGMICSKQELGLEEKSSGIWILDDGSLEPGQSLHQYLEFDDYIFSFEITSNRPDLLSVRGIARELAVIFGWELSFPSTSLDRLNETDFSVGIQDPRDTPRYSCRVLKEVTIGSSPLKMQHRLAKAGLRPKNNVVDATNYVMVEMGHPLHPFDRNRVEGDTISVRRAEKGETLITIDGEKRELEGKNLVIADGRGPIALAGIMGGQNSEISSISQDILLESACFSPAAIRESAKNLNMRSEASRRFERGADEEVTIAALDRVTQLLTSQGCCDWASEPIDNYPAPWSDRSITFHPAKTEKIVGEEIGADVIESILTGLGFEISAEEETLRVGPPSFRKDVSREIDLVEEIARIYGYDRIRPSSPRTGTVSLDRDVLSRAFRTARSILIGLGLYEVINPGFAPSNSFRSKDELVSLTNPMGERRSSLRPELSSGLIVTAERNFQEGVRSIKMFELGKVFLSGEDGRQERHNLAALMGGRRYVPRDQKESYDFWDLKGVLEVFLSEFISSDFDFENGGPDFLHPTRKGTVYSEGKKLGFIGELRSRIWNGFDLPSRVHLFELDFDRLVSLSQFEKTYTPLPQYPPSRRDISLVVPKSLEEKEVRKVFLDEDKVEDLYLYDIYEGEQIESGRIGLTYEVTLRDPQRTLDDEAVDAVVDRIRSRLSQEDIAFRD